MAGQSIPSTAPDVEAWLIQTFAAAVSPAIVRNVKPPLKLPSGATNPDAAKDQVIIRADLQNRATPISRYCRVGVQGWKVRADGTADLAGAFALAATFGQAVERAERAGLLLEAEIDGGPYRVRDTTTGVEYAYLTLLLEVATA